MRIAFFIVLLLLAGCAEEPVLKPVFLEKTSLISFSDCNCSHVFIPPEGRGYSEAYMDANPMNPLQMAVVWKDFRQSPAGFADDVQASYAVTNDGGASWSTGMLEDLAGLVDVDAGPAVHSANYDAEVKYGFDGTLYVVNAGFTKTGDQDLQSQLYIHTSKDNGATWTSEVIDTIGFANGDTVSEEATGVYRRGFDQPSFAVDREGLITVSATINTGLGSFPRVYQDRDGWSLITEEAGFGGLSSFWLRMEADEITVINYKADGENVAIFDNGTWMHQKTKPSIEGDYFGHTVSVSGSKWTAGYGALGQLHYANNTGLHTWISGDFSRIQNMKTGPDGSKAALVNQVTTNGLDITSSSTLYVEHNGTVYEFNYAPPSPGVISAGNEYSGLTWNNGTDWAAFAEVASTTELDASIQSIRIEAAVPIYETELVEVKIEE